MEFIQPLWPAYPELFLLVAVCVILIADLFVNDENRIVTYGLTQAALAGMHRPHLAWPTREPVYTFSDMFVDDLMSDVLKLFVCLSVMAVLVYSRAYIAARGMFRGRVLRAHAVRDARHDDHDLGEPPAHAVSRARADDRCRSIRWSRCSAIRRPRPRPR